MATVEVDQETVEFAADHLKELAKYAYSKNDTANGDTYHGHARALNEATDRDWEDVGGE